MSLSTLDLTHSLSKHCNSRSILPLYSFSKGQATLMWLHMCCLLSHPVSTSLFSSVFCASHPRALMCCLLSWLADASVFSFVFCHVLLCHNHCSTNIRINWYICNLHMLRRKAHCFTSVLTMLATKYCSKSVYLRTYSTQVRT